jgi:hypothetical protein
VGERARLEGERLLGASGGGERAHPVKQVARLARIEARDALDHRRRVGVLAMASEPPCLGEQARDLVAAHAPQDAGHAELLAR